jgi:putative protein-disulfide isomerase
MKTTLIYVHDPMCSWCWGFSDVYQQLLELLPEGIEVRRLLGGLALDSDEPMPESMQAMLQQTWHHIEEMIPGKRFNFDFWTQCLPRRSTYPACRAVIAAREQGEQYDPIMTAAIQQAYYLRAMNPSDIETLVTLAEELHLDTQKFAQDLESKWLEQEFERQLEFTRRSPTSGFPSLAIDLDGQLTAVVQDYRSHITTLEHITSLLAGHTTRA